MNNQLIKKVSQLTLAIAFILNFTVANAGNEGRKVSKYYVEFMAKLNADYGKQIQKDDKGNNMDYNSAGADLVIVEKALNEMKFTENETKIPATEDMKSGFVSSYNERVEALNASAANKNDVMNYYSAKRELMRLKAIKSKIESKK